MHLWYNALYVTPPSHFSQDKWGLVGQNGIWKTTALKILGGKLKPNFGRFEEDSPDRIEIVTHFEGSELQTYFVTLVEDKLKVLRNKKSF
jgi:translation initiation factor RLI1